MSDAERCEIDGYRVYEWLPRNKHLVGKGGAVNWDDRQRSMLRGG